ncbi:MAG: hypothetical protein QME96_12900, partial [Myxococcota bacterium]|nr:hypothetical protein [Myxococcota bacterium]
KRLVRGEDGTSWAVYDGGGGGEVFRGVRPGDVITVAGNGTRVYAGSGLEATRAATWQPTGVAFDGDGRIWIAHWLGYMRGGALSVVGADGNLATVIPPHGVSHERLPLGGGLAWSPRTGLLMVNEGRGVSRVDCLPDPAGPAGLSCRLEPFAGGGTASPADGIRATDARLLVLRGDGIWVSPAGEVYVPTFSHEVWKIDAGGILRRFAGTGTPGYSGDDGPATAAKLKAPSDVAGDSDGNVYIADTANVAVRRVDPGGTITTVVGTGVTVGWTPDGQLARGNPSLAVYSVAVSPAGEVYFGTTLRWWGWEGGLPGALRKIGPRGELITVVGNMADIYSGEGVRGDRSGSGLPGQIAFDAAGEIHYADVGAHRVRKMAGSNGGPMRMAPLPGVFSTLVALPDGAFELHRKGGTRDLFDASGRHLATVAPDGSAMTYEYDDAGRVVAVADSVGRQARFDYDRWGKLSRITDFSGARTLFTVDSAGDLVRVEMEGHAGTARTLAYDRRHLIVSQTDGGRTSEYAYDANRMVSSVRVAGRPHRTIAAADGRFLNNGLAGRTGVPLLTSWDSYGFPFTAVVTDERGVTREYAYGHAGVMTGWRVRGDPWRVFDRVLEVDASGLATRYSPGPWLSPTYEREYDPRGNLVWEWSNYLETIYRYDPRCDRPVYRSQAYGRLRNGKPFLEEGWEYDSSCRLVRHVDPAGLVTRYTYDRLTGLLAEESDDAGWKVRYQYDSLGRTIRIERRDGSVTDTDDDGRGIGTGQPPPIEPRDPSITEMEYDAADRVIREVRTGAGGVREETRRTYDALGRLVFVEGPGGALTEYRYGDGPGGGCCGARAAGPTEVIDPDGNVTRYEYDAEGRIVAVIDPTGARTTRDYDPGGMLAGSTDAARRST